MFVSNYIIDNFIRMYDQEDGQISRKKEILSAGHISVKQFQVLVIEICFRQSIQGQHGEFRKQREDHGIII